MKRRSALKHIGFGVSAGLMLPTYLSSCKKEDDPKPEINYAGVVAIIGAGAAGLYAADILLSKGINVRLLEASDRVGGRIRSLKPFDKPTEALLFDPESELSSDFPTELGAERIVGTDSLWAKIVNQQKVSTVEFNTIATDRYFIEGALADSATILTDSDFIAAKNFLDSLVSYSGGNSSVAQAIQAAGLNSRVYAILNSWIGNKYGTSNDRLGITSLAQGMALLTRNRQELLLQDNLMEDVLNSRFSSAASRVELNTIVRNINYGSEKIVINGEKKTSAGSESFSIEADKVIVTVPISVLKDGDITFSPAFPSAKATALSRMEMDASLRIHLDFKQNFWGEASGFLYGGAQSPEYFNSGVGRSTLLKTMSITINGPKAEEFSPLGKNAIPLLLSELDSIFEGKATANVRRDLNNNFIAVIQDWTKETFIKGSAAYLKAGGTNDDRINLAAPISERLFFAGEGTDVSGEFATVNGALHSAERVVQEVIDSI